MVDFYLSCEAMWSRICDLRRFKHLVVVLIGCLILFSPCPGLSQETSGRYVVDSEKALLSPSSKETPAKNQVPVNQPHLLKGTFCSWSGSSSSSGSYSSSKWARFDGIGRFLYGSSTSYSGTAGSLHNGSRDSGGDYEVRGDYIYLRYDDGGCDVATVHFRTSNGVITEVMFEGSVYAAALCE
ncbi:MAG: hypothetical protein J7M09_06585 [Deltaproteobacteria bacterium]|nr:hypothetical protein [Candidatus Tharpella sp.]